MKKFKVLLNRGDYNKNIVLHCYVCNKTIYGNTDCFKVLTYIFKDHDLDLPSTSWVCSKECETMYILREV